MPFLLSFSVDGDQQVLRRLERMRHRTTDLTPAFEQMHKSFLALERKQFASQGQSGSGGWKPISKEWLDTKTEWKASGKKVTDQYGTRTVVDTRILHMTLLLRRSLTNKTHAQHIKEIGPQEAYFGTSVFYADYHQNPKKKSNRRRPVELTESQRRAWVRYVQRALLEETRRSEGRIPL